jgi:hypothetical protein
VILVLVGVEMLTADYIKVPTHIMLAAVAAVLAAAVGASVLVANIERD